MQLIALITVAFDGYSRRCRWNMDAALIPPLMPTSLVTHLCLHTLLLGAVITQATLTGNRTVSFLLASEQIKGCVWPW